MLQKGGYDARWQPVLTQWITQVLQTPLNEEGVSLSQL
jgi:exodeoxyribonuclease V beta subunit